MLSICRRTARVHVRVAIVTVAIINVGRRREHARLNDVKRRSTEAALAKFRNRREFIRLPQVIIN